MSSTYRNQRITPSANTCIMIPKAPVIRPTLHSLDSLPFLELPPARIQCYEVSGARKPNVEVIKGMDYMQSTQRH